jgi:uncharacterized protein YegP (UPF0339 family)
MATKQKKLPKSSMPKVKNPQKGFIEVYKSMDPGTGKGLWRWRLKGSNGKVIANGAEGYVTHAGVLNAASRMIDYNLSEVTISELEEVVVEPAPVPPVPPGPQPPIPTPIPPIGSDITPPVVGIAQPGADATVSGHVAVVVDASDTGSGVKSVELFLDQTSYGSKTTPEDGRYRFSVASMNHPNGRHFLKAVADDKAGNRATSAQVAVDIVNSSTQG